MPDKLKFDYEVDEEVGKRLTALFADLPANSVMASIEEFIDHYTSAVHGVNIMSTIRKLNPPAKGQSVCTQTLAGGRALLVSSYGFTVLSETQCNCGRARITIDECSLKDMEDQFQGG